MAAHSEWYVHSQLEHFFALAILDLLVCDLRHYLHFSCSKDIL